jgi:MOSC domain-containing protein YiiM
MQALSLWSADVIESLRADGHSVHPGAAGENLTVAGIDWSTIRPGVRLAIGAVVAEISSFATPCAKNAQWFHDRDFRRIDHARNPGSSRAYAWVICGGSVAPGDLVIVEPDD